MSDVGVICGHVGADVDRVQDVRAPGSEAGGGEVARVCPNLDMRKIFHQP